MRGEYAPMRQSPEAAPGSFIALQDGLPGAAALIDYLDRLAGCPPVLHHRESLAAGPRQGRVDTVAAAPRSPPAARTRRDPKHNQRGRLTLSTAAPADQTRQFEQESLLAQHDIHLRPKHRGGRRRLQRERHVRARVARLLPKAPIRLMSLAFLDDSPNCVDRNSPKDQLCLCRTVGLRQFPIRAIAAG